MLKRVAVHAQETQTNANGELRFKEPWLVTQRAWSEAADSLAPELGWIGRPNGIVKQLRADTGKPWSWQMWLRRAFSVENPEKFAMSLTRREAREATIGDAFRSMLLVTAELGHVPSGQPEYDTAYHSIRARAAAAGRLAQHRGSLRRP